VKQELVEHWGRRVLIGAIVTKNMTFTLISVMLLIPGLFVSYCVCPFRSPPLHSALALNHNCCSFTQETMITVNNLALLIDSKKGGGGVAGSEADQFFRRAMPFTPRDVIPHE